MTSSIAPARVVASGAASVRPEIASRIIGTGLVLVIVLQRLGIPVGGVSMSVTLPIGFAVLAALLAVRAVEHDIRRTALYVIAAGACAVAAWFTTWRGLPMAVTSFLLLVVVYVPWLFRLRPGADPDATARAVARLFVRIMTLAGGVAAAQLAAQLSGAWTFDDVVARVVPEQFLLGDFNTVIPLQYGSPTMKSQAFVFLEPSFLSQFLALGILIALLVRAPLWQPLLMGLGMAATFSGTGMILLGVGAVLLLVRSPASLRPSVLVGTAVVTAAFLSTPLSAPLLNRTQETSQPTSSWSLRFVLPYEEVAGGLASDPVRYLTGAGPGSAERVLPSDKQGDGPAVVYPVAPKLFFEYGLLAGGLFLVFWLMALLRRPSMPVVPGTLVVMLGVLSGSLLQPHTLMTAWLLCVVYAHD